MIDLEKSKTHLRARPRTDPPKSRRDASQEDFHPGDKVTYFSFNNKENGIVKSISDQEHVFVVYNCDDNWDDYQNYTAARTRREDLRKGWQ